MKTYRPAKASEVDQIVDFQVALASETENMKLNRETATLGVQALFDRPHLGSYHVCEIDGKVIGCMMLQSEWSDWRNGQVLWIHSVYILPEFRRHKVFTGFYEYAKSMVKADPSIRGIRLYVDKTNIKAQATYRNLGMTDEHYLLFENLNLT